MANQLPRNGILWKPDNQLVGSIIQGETMKTIIGRRRSIGLAGAALWLIAISFFFVTWSLLAIGTPLARLILIGSSVLVGVFVIASIVVIRAALGLAVSTVPQTREEQQIGRRFAWVFGFELLAFAVVNSILTVIGNFELMPCLNLIVVGVHFFPLARIFRVPRYNAMGLLFCAIPVVTLLAIPKQFEIGHTLAWYVAPSIGCGLVAIVTAAAGLRESWISVSTIRGVIEPPTQAD
jgi:hypothetical protein